MKEYTYGILVSGDLGYKCLELINQVSKVDFVCTDKSSESIIGYCKENNIPIYSGNPRNAKIANFLKGFNSDVLLSINYLFLIDGKLLGFPRLYAINIHGSLLPKYRGRTPHVWAIINNEKEAGITAHLISDECDAGEIVYQEKVTIDSDITGYELLEIYKKRYLEIVKYIINCIELEQLRSFPQNHNQATYFGKRIPDDGKINWNWQWERIFNWVRAQAKPYPGAFTFYENQKVIIHKIKYVNYGFSNSTLNGMILFLNESEIIVKTPNGTIQLVDFDIPESIVLKQGGIFHE